MGSGISSSSSMISSSSSSASSMSASMSEGLGFVDEGLGEVGGGLEDVMLALDCWSDCWACLSSCLSFLACLAWESVELELRTWVRADWAWATSSLRPAFEDWSRVFSVSSSLRLMRRISKSDLAW